MLYLATENKTALESIHEPYSPSVLKSSQYAIWLRGEAINCLNKLLLEPATAATESTILLRIHHESLRGTLFLDF
jgi:putative SOS response-associated peptidase YedK